MKVTTNIENVLKINVWLKYSLKLIFKLCLVKHIRLLKIKIKTETQKYGVRILFYKK